MLTETAPRRKRSVACPVNGQVEVVCISLDNERFAWCKRSGIVCQVAGRAPACPLLVLIGTIPEAARWACPVDR